MGSAYLTEFGQKTLAVLDEDEKERSGGCGHFAMPKGKDWNAITARIGISINGRITGRYAGPASLFAVQRRRPPSPAYPKRKGRWKSCDFGTPLMPRR
jgi:hypothetical protein